MKIKHSLNVVRQRLVTSRAAQSQKVLLVRPPFFSPMTPPLGIGMLKAHLEARGHEVTCFDWNVDGEIWLKQREYFSELESLDDAKISDGDSKLWSVLNTHLLAFMAGCDETRCNEVLRLVTPYYGLRLGDPSASRLHAIISGLYARLDALLDQLDLSRVQFVGTSTYTTSLGPSLFVLQRVKQRHPQLRTVMGGGVFADDLALGSDNLQTLLDDFDFVDHIAIGEGELLLQRLVEGDFANQRVISLADVGQGELDIASVPMPDFSDFNSKAYLQLSIEGGRSCPFQCSFCSETVQWGNYRKKPAALLADQMLAMASKYDQKRFFMGDSLVNPYVPGLSAELLTRNSKLLYDGYMRADKSVGDSDRVEQWARSGMYRARLGIETASTRMLGLMDKMTTPSTILGALRSLAENGIRTATTWIAGHPGETEQDFEETLAFVRESHRFIYDLHAHPFSYFPYGQVASRLYESVSVFPGEVSEAMRFKIWDVANAEPAREERFSRLQRFSALAAELGLPRTYSMAERYAAEKRWARLSPKAREVY